MRARRPSHLSEHTLASLTALASRGLGHLVSLGGAVGLSHYLDYRPTHDVDAWWSPQATRQEREEVLAAVKEALSSFGRVETRAWGDVVSLDLRKDAKTVFSFQVAARTVQLEPSVAAGWVDVHLDSLPDLLASKMVALIERGAPRDFLDIHKACRESVTTERECWALWRSRQQRAGSDNDFRRARLAIETHLQRIAKHRPLEAIDEPARREQADAVRRWFRAEFLSAIPG